MNRREFVNGLTFALLAAPLAADAQKEAKVARIGLLGVTSRATSLENLEPFRHELRERDWVEGQNIVIEERGAETAKALGLTIPPSVLIRADEVIQ